ncbi:hypothetical protein ACTXT7_009425 [Hymenolepis weldensis]
MNPCRDSLANSPSTSNEPMDFQDIISYENTLTDLDQSLGHLEEIIIKTEDKGLQEEEIYFRYKNLIGNYIDRTLAERSSRLDLQNIFDQMHSQSLFSDGEIYDLLCALCNFENFKEFMLDFKNSKETMDSGLSLSNALSSHVSINEPSHVGDSIEPYS